MTRDLTLYRYNRITGYWVFARTVTPDTAEQWLHIWQSSEPTEHFIVAKRKPTQPPK